MRYEGASADLDRTLMALADPIRRQILRRLAGSDARVTDVAAEFSISLNSVSKHIRLLERAQLVERNVLGREHILRFHPAPLTKVQKWIAAQEAFWASRLQAIDDLLLAEDAASETPPQKKKAKEKKHARKG
jgi:DNA-binding transcriptional ArsR family regulator